MMTFKKLLILTSLSIIFIIQPAIAAEYQQVAGLIDTRTTFSDGAFDVEALARLAKQRGFDVLFINDHDLLAMEYGLAPLKNILKKRVELNSINKGGAENYLNAVNKAREKYPDMILIPGSESVPFYYWKGSFVKQNLTAHDHEKRILTIGMEKPEDYKNLPIIHNGFSTRYLNQSLPVVIVFLISFVLGLLLLMDRGYFRISGLIISGLSFLFMINAHPFQSSPFDQYHGNQGIAPYQLLIDYVNTKGGFTFWNYPETGSGVRKLGPIFLNTPPYPAALEQSVDYTGFAALYGDNITATEPGHQWDRVLLDFCNGKRKQPVWGIATADYHS
ncbi:PHP domain-containing protein, partial [Thermodesulfobacteriota bacterium]